MRDGGDILLYSAAEQKIKPRARRQKPYEEFSLGFCRHAQLIYLMFWMK